MISTKLINRINIILTKNFFQKQQQSILANRHPEPKIPDSIRKARSNFELSSRLVRFTLKTFKNRFLLTTKISKL